MAAERCSADGMTSLLLCPMFTWSLGCTLTLEELAAWAITSFAFMLLLVPDPV